MKSLKGKSISDIAKWFNISEVLLFTEVQNKILIDKYFKFSYVPTDTKILNEIVSIATKIAEKNNPKIPMENIVLYQKTPSKDKSIKYKTNLLKKEIKQLDKKIIESNPANQAIENCRLYNLKFYDGYIKYRNTDKRYDISFSLRALNKIAEKISDHVEILNYGDKIEIPEKSIDKIYQLIKAKSNNEYGFNYLFDETYVCPWSNIFFDEGCIKFYPPNNKCFSDHLTPYIIQDSYSRACFNGIKEYFKKIFGDVKVKAKNNEIYELISDIKLWKVIDIDDQDYHLKFPDLLKERRTIEHPKQKYKVSTEFNFEKACLIDSSMILAHIKEQKSKYLDELCNCQLEGYNIILANERQITVSNGDSHGHDQVAFMFTIKELYSCSWIVFENVEFDKSSYVFIVKTEYYSDAVQFIFDFFNSDIPNKRTSIYAYRELFRSAGIVTFFRKLHIYLPIWKQNIESGNMIAKWRDHLLDTQEI
jgi:hypothetical protein